MSIWYIFSNFAHSRMCAHVFMRICARSKIFSLGKKCLHCFRWQNISSVFNQRFERIEHRLANIEERQDSFDLEIRASLPPREGIFFDGQIFDAYKFVQNVRKDVGKDVGKELTERQQIILHLMSENDQITTIEMSEKMSGKKKVQTRTLDRDIKSLTKMGYIARIGGRKQGHWVILKQ